MLNSDQKIDFILSPVKRLEKFQELGISFCMMLDADLNFFLKTPYEFVKEILVDILNTEIIVVGNNFRFGRDAAGGVEDLKKYQDEFGFELLVEPLKKIENKILNSTMIRKAIYDRKFDLANLLLGRTIFFKGHVIHGMKRGRKLGFPTINLKNPVLKNLEEGIYSVRVWSLSKKYLGVMNIGHSPTMKCHQDKEFEIHLLGYDGDELYGHEIYFQILQKIRDEKKFSSASALSRQIENDVQETIKHFGCFF